MLGFSDLEEPPLGVPVSGVQRMALAKNTGSILDSVAQETAGPAGPLGPAYRTKLNEYSDSVREIEQRIDGGKARTKA